MPQKIRTPGQYDDPELTKTLREENQRLTKTLREAKEQKKNKCHVNTGKKK